MPPHTDRTVFEKISIEDIKRVGLNKSNSFRALIDIMAL
jgi:hypothetical protein